MQPATKKTLSSYLRRRGRSKHRPRRTPTPHTGTRQSQPSLSSRAHSRPDPNDLPVQKRAVSTAESRPGICISEGFSKTTPSRRCCASSGREGEGGQQRRNVSHILSSPPPPPTKSSEMSTGQTSCKEQQSLKRTSSPIQEAALKHKKYIMKRR